MILHIIIIFLPFVRKSLYIVYSFWTHSDILASSTANHLCMMVTDGIIRFRSIQTDTDGRTQSNYTLLPLKLITHCPVLNSSEGHNTSRSVAASAACPTLRPRAAASGRGLRRSRAACPWQRPWRLSARLLWRRAAAAHPARHEFSVSSWKAERLLLVKQRIRLHSSCIRRRIGRLVARSAQRYRQIDC